MYAFMLFARSKELKLNNVEDAASTTANADSGLIRQPNTIMQFRLN